MQGVGRGRSEFQVFASLLTNPGFSWSQATRISLPTKINSNQALWKEQGSHSEKNFRPEWGLKEGRYCFCDQGVPVVPTVSRLPQLVFSKKEES